MMAIISPFGQKDRKMTRLRHVHRWSLLLLLAGWQGAREIPWAGCFEQNTLFVFQFFLKGGAKVSGD